MKRIILSGIAMLALTTFATMFWSSAAAQDNKSHNDDDESYFNDFPDNPGLWSAIIREDKVYIQFGGRHWSSGATFALDELGKLPTDKPGSFTVKRDAGTVTFNGVFDGRRGHGTYSFEEDPAFKSYLTQEGFTSISENLMIHLYFTNINHAYFAFMKENGYTGITMTELKDLAEHNMNQHIMTNYLELFRKDNYGQVRLEKIVELRDHGVDPEFVADMRKIGQTTITLDQAVELRDHGVSADFIKGFRELGFKDISLSKAVELVDHGVSVEFVKRMQEKGLKNMSLDEYIRLRDGGM